MSNPASRLRLLTGLACSALVFALSLPGAAPAAAASRMLPERPAGTRSAVIQAGLLIQERRPARPDAAKRGKLGPELLVTPPPQPVATPSNPGLAHLLDLLGVLEPAGSAAPSADGSPWPYGRWTIGGVAVLGVLGCGGGMLRARNNARAAHRMFARLTAPGETGASA